MPQMMPMNWLTLPLSFLICYLILISLLFSLKFQLAPSFNNKEIMTFKVTWKW